MTGHDPADRVLHALAEPRRRAILRLVARDELAAGQIAAAFDVTRTAVSQHLTVLKNAGLLSERRAGTRRLYRARPEGLAGLQAFLDEMWADALDTARRLVEADRGLSDTDQQRVGRASPTRRLQQRRLPRRLGHHPRPPRRRGRSGAIRAKETLMSVFLYKFVPHRADFPTTMTDTEAKVMAEHVTYWQALADSGTAVAFGPVADPSGSWGVAIVEATTEDEVHAIRAADPVVTNDLGPVDIYPMPDAITRRP